VKPKHTRLWLLFGGLLVALLLAAVITLGSFDLPFEPSRWDEVIAYFALSTFTVAALMVFGLILTRMLLRLWQERQAGQFGTHFRTKMVIGAMALSLLPIVFMFFISYGLLNRTLSRWFSAPLENAASTSQRIVNELGARDHERLLAYAAVAANSLQPGASPVQLHELLTRFAPGVDGILILDGSGAPAAFASNFGEAQTDTPHFDSKMPSGEELWRISGGYAAGGRAPLGQGTIVVFRRLPETFIANYTEAQTQMRHYDVERQEYRAYKVQLLLSLSLFTLLLIFAVIWFALYLSKQVTVPIQALAEGTREVSRGNFDHRVDIPARDELGTLVQSFNEMTSQLGDSKRQIDTFTQSLQHAVQEIERRRKLLEAVLENIPTGVISVDTTGLVIRVNGAAAKMFGESVDSAQTLAELVGADAYPKIQPLLRRAMRLGTVSEALEFSMRGRILHAAVTVSALGSPRSNPGYVVVIDDLTDLLRAQKAAAWQEVAQRIAHEIKNPLTPIQLSAQRLERYLSRRGGDAGSAPAADDPGLESLVRECTRQIEREVATMKNLVDEFSQFVRFPQARMAPADANSVVTAAVDVFRDRLDGITIRTELAGDLPQIKADSELLRGVIVNLIDNAAEALEDSKVKEVTVRTRATRLREMLEIVVEDTGPGISPQDKDRLFLPHFSTKERGTGLGLAIAARVIAEHNGSIRVEDNSPVGSRFIIALPVVEVPATPIASEA
jgi:two-component system, NtrC family, nitrogen regulation sensor histidine kinase NtrY